jgi:hypothetical protein
LHDGSLPFISGLNKIGRDDKFFFVQHGFGNLNAKRGKKIKCSLDLKKGQKWVR